MMQSFVIYNKIQEEVRAIRMIMPPSVAEWKKSAHSMATLESKDVCEKVLMESRQRIIFMLYYLNRNEST